MTDGSTTVTCDSINVDPSITDIFINDIGEIFLKAERNFGCKGRIYAFNYAASDSAGNCTETSAKVVVPHWRSFFPKK